MDYLKQSVIDYVKKNNTDYAIMINGTWGSGKTYFWNNEIKNEIENIKVEDNKVNNVKNTFWQFMHKEDTKNVEEKDKYYRTIYISLYGINNLDEISKSLFVQAFSSKNNLFSKFAKSKVGNAVSELGKLVLNGAEAFGYSFGDKQIDLSKFTSFENVVLCFDDLERSHIEVSEVLGFINNLVEHDNIKAIIIANEKEISEKISKVNYELKALTAISLLDKTGAFNAAADKHTKEKDKKKPNSELVMNMVNETFDKTNEYKRIKEKLIGKTLTYTPNYEAIINSLIDQYKHVERFFRIISDYKQIIIDIFYKSETLNLRILRHSLSDYEIIFNNLTRTYPEIDERTLLSLLAFTFAYSFETKSGNIDPKLFYGFNSNSDYLAHIYGALITKGDCDTPIMRFNNKYFGGTTSKHVFFKFAETYISTGFFETQVMIEEIDTLIKSSDRSTIPSYKKLFFYPYWDLSDEEFEIALDESFNTVKNGDMHYICYFRGYITFLILERQGLLKSSMKDYHNIFLEGLELTKDKFQSKDDLSIDLMLPGDKDQRDNKVLNTIRNRIIEINDHGKEQEIKGNMEALFNLLLDNIYNFKKEVDEYYYSIPIFAYYNMNKLFSTLRLLSNSQLVDFRNYVEDRYKHVQNQYIKDYDNLVSLQKMVDEYTSGKANSLNICIMLSLKETLNNICIRINTEKNPPLN